MKANEVTKIRYTRATSLGEGETGDVTERVIIPTFVPLPNIKALDVTDLTDTERAEYERLYQEYVEYYETHVRTLFTFEDWMEHTAPDGKRQRPKWRTFKLENIEVLEE